MPDPFGDRIDPLVKSMRASAVKALVERAVNAERERCAKIALKEAYAFGATQVGKAIAKAIRA